MPKQFLPGENNRVDKQEPERTTSLSHEPDPPLPDDFRCGTIAHCLSYGVDPARILPQLMQINSISGDLTHILRAITDLCLALIALWVIGAWRGGEPMRTALISEIVFMSGLTAGRLLSLLPDDWPSPIIITYTFAEILLSG